MLITACKVGIQIVPTCSLQKHSCTVLRMILSVLLLIVCSIYVVEFLRNPLSCYIAIVLRGTKLHQYVDCKIGGVLIAIFVPVCRYARP